MSQAEVSGQAGPAKVSKKEYLKGWVSYRVKRYWFFVGMTIVSLVLPWITINGNHIFLLSFDKLKLHLAFVQFDMQEMYLMPFILMILFIGVFGMTVLGGRVFCGWVCPQTIFRVIYRDLIETKILKLRKRIKNKQKEPDWSKPENKAKRVVAIALWTALSLLATANFLWFFVPPEDFFPYLMNAGDHLILVGILLITTLFLVVDVVWFKENWCVYVCPYSRIQSVLYDEDTVMAIYDPHRGGEIYDEAKHKQYTKQKDLQAVEPNAECTTCESCVTVCPTHIDIRQGLQLECINCLECVDACTEVMGALGRPSLVRWSSEKEVLFQKGKTHYLRPKIIGYAVVLVIIMVVLGMMGSKKEHMLLNINKENRLYAIEKTPEGKTLVENDYIFLLQNTQDKDHKFYFDIEAPKGMEGKIKILKPTKPFTVHPGVKKKKIVRLYTTEELVKDERKDTVLPIKIHAYAIDDKEKIAVDRESTFIFPRYDKYEAAE
ncbi:MULTISPECIES: cytochrome c oxidase accessory protein CcoG [Sulfurimonadaceae]|uniref:cytochrome c oxidase accessory protein CcoG n=1 Tax=Sulfurimonadaceae TaxID=2771471 RepID=UPI0021042DF2|nr:cytochrome c oxidase accessory protein CcoG [Sulfurimonas sp. HSL-3221]